MACFFLLLMLAAPRDLFAFSDKNGDGIPVLRFDSTTLSSWKQHEFKGKTVYESVTVDGRSAVKAASRGAASAFYREMTVDIQKYPILSWSWRLVEAPENPDEEKKTGDDFGARVYVVVKTGFLPWQLIVLNYVWSMNTRGPVTWTSPYSENVVMIAVDRGKDGFGKWISHRVNVAADLKAAFGKNFNEIDGIAVMTDMDNTDESATAFYGEIDFSAR